MKIFEHETDVAEWLTAHGLKTTTADVFRAVQDGKLRTSRVIQFDGPDQDGYALEEMQRYLRDGGAAPKPRTQAILDAEFAKKCEAEMVELQARHAFEAAARRATTGAAK